jgi:hypothetical protein
MSVISQLAALEDLNLDYTDVSDNGFESLRPLNGLQRLSLDSANVTDKSALVITEFKRLAKLNLYHTLITEKGYREIREALPNCEIIFDPKSSDPKRRRS